MTGMDDVTIRPMQPKPSLFPEPAPEPKAAFEPPPPAAFLPPVAERPNNRGPRMPRIDEFPRPVQDEVRQARGEAPPPEAPEKRRMGLLQRLASVGLGGGRRDEAAREPDTSRQQVRPMRAPAEPRPFQGRPAPRPEPPRPADPVSEYAKRQPHQGLDPLGRQAPVHNSPEEDQLDIPAFLRRQAN
jgi:cell division protein FtsZ